MFLDLPKRAESKQLYLLKMDRFTNSHGGMESDDYYGLKRSMLFLIKILY